MAVVVFAALFALALLAGEKPVSYEAALFLAGLVAPAVSQWVKKRAGKDGPVAFYLTLAVSVAISVVVAFYYGEVHSVGDVFRSGMTVLGTATAVFKTLQHAAQASDSLPLDPPPAEQEGVNK